MKILTTEEAIIAMVEGKQITSDKFCEPDYTYCIYDKTIKNELPFRYIRDNINTAMDSVWNIKTWRLRKYIPRDKELCFVWDDDDIASSFIRYYDAKNNCTFDYKGDRLGLSFHNYAPYIGKLPPNICKPKELED